MTEARFELIVLGAGPAGLAAAKAAADSGREVLVLDDNPLPGGQIWRGGPDQAPNARARAAFSALQHPRIAYRPGARLFAAPGPGTLLVELPEGGCRLGYGQLILATGARERFLPFPGWTLPGVFGLGGLQALAKGGYPVAGKRIVLAGTGPLLLAVADTLKARGARVLLLAEQAPLGRVARFAAGLVRHPAKLAQAVALKSRLLGIPYRCSSHVLEASGRERLERLRLSWGGEEGFIDCDYLGCAFGLLPNTETGQLLGCTLAAGAVAVDDYQQTSRPGVYAAGEACGIGGVDKAQIEGRIAGLAAAGRPEEARRLFPARAHARDFADRLAEAFRLEPALLRLARPDTLICRCEDVPLQALQSCSSWREAKLLTRCGMGACQGRTCGPMAETLLGFEPRGSRPPLQPVSLETLVSALSPTDPR
ncbi:MAG: NAD(P)/FAD-dependent oxidoreductase [Gammaproteobacteria bacterium]|nr:NAD(P)/FAD-dependent oxidoreductase [Gammaproteobacteria bacterium]